MKMFLQFTTVWQYFRDNIVETTLLITVLCLICQVLISYFKKYRKLPPGPWGLPIVGYLPFLGEEPHKNLAKLKEKYGNVFGLKMGIKYVVVLNEYNVFKEAINHPATFNRPDGLLGPIRLGFGVAKGADWSEQRKYVLHVMRNLGLGRGPWEKLTQESAAHFIQELKTYKGKPVIITEELQGTLASNIMSLLYGHKYERDTEKDKIQALAKFSHLGLKHYGPSTPASLIPGFHRICEILKIGDYAKSAESTKEFLTMAESEIQKHFSDNEYENLEDFANLYKTKLQDMKTHEGKHFFNDSNMLGNANSLFLGSSDTGTSSLRTLFRLMAVHQDVQKKVRKELDEVIGREGSVGYDDRSKVPYTFAVMLEAQRYISTVPLANTRELSEDMEVEGYILPKGTWLMSNIYAMHNDPNYWKNPRTFQPERFLTEDKREVIKNPKSFVPFSAGKRNCPGETVAWMLILAVFSRVMQNFSICLPSGEEVNFGTEGGVVSHLKPQPLCFAERP